MGPEAFFQSAEGADVVFPNLDEGRALTGAAGPEEVATSLATRFPIVALKLGAGGVMLATGGDEMHRLPARVDATAGVIDPTGAGDAFCAGFLGAWLSGAGATHALDAGIDAASQALGTVGGRPPAGHHHDDGVPWEKLRAAARRVAANAYAPWSGLAVGAAGLAGDGRIVAGCNVENASYGLTLCAECGLVSALHAAGSAALVAVTVVAADGRPLAPCGRCRQVLLDNGGPSLLVDAGPDRPAVRLALLLPGAFDAATLQERRTL